MAKQNYRCAGCGTRIDPGIVFNLVSHTDGATVTSCSQTQSYTAASPLFRLY